MGRVLEKLGTIVIMVSLAWKLEYCNQLGFVRLPPPPDTAPEDMFAVVFDYVSAGTRSWIAEGYYTDVAG